MSKRISSSDTYLCNLAGTGTRRSSNPNARSSLLGRASGGAAAAALAVAFLAPKSAQAVPFFTDLTTTNFPDPQVCIGDTTNNPATGTIPATKAGCFTHWLVASDLDQDGDLDLMFANGGGYYLTGNSESSTAYVNDGTGLFTDVNQTMFGGALGRIRQVAIGDIDNDGDRDILQLGSYGVNLDRVWIQTSPGVYEDRASEHLPPDSKTRTPGYHLGDLDNDGDLDLLVADWGLGTTAAPVVLKLFLNDGTGKFALVESQSDGRDVGVRLPPTIPFQPSASGAAAILSNPYWGVRAIDIDFADIDNDFDLDILVNMRNGISRILINDGNAHFKDGNGDVRYQRDENGNVVFVAGRPVVLSNYPMKFGPYVYNQEVCDYDNDGDLDLLLDNAGRRPDGVNSGNFTQVLQNDGSGKFVDVTRETIFGEPGADDNAVKCADVNNDGRYDLAVASLGAFEKLLVQDSTGKFNYVAGGIPAVSDSSLGIEMGDFDGDGIFDLVTGQGEGGSYVDRYYKGVADVDGSAKDTRPPNFRKIETPAAEAGKPIVFHMAITDAVTSETGEHLKLVSVGYSGLGVAGTVKPTFMGGDLWRVVIPAQPAYKTLTITATATDRANNKAFSPAIILTVQPPAPVGSGGNGGAGGTAGSGGTAGTAGSGGTAGTAGTGGTDPGVGGEGGFGGEPVPGAGGAPDGGTAGSPPDGSAGEGTAGSPPDGTGGTSDSGGTSSSGGKGGKGGSGGDETGEGGEGGSSAGKSSSGKKDDDGGCTVTSATTGSSTGGWLAAVGLALAAGLRRRRRSE